MHQEPDATPIPGLDGTERQAVGQRMWNAWRSGGRGAAVLTGISGVGKSEGVVRPLLARAAQNGAPTVLLNVPFDSLDMDAALLSGLRDELGANDNNALAKSIRNLRTFGEAVRELLRQGTLVVLDESQRLLGLDGRPAGPMADTVRRIATRSPDRGCLWLLSNRRIDPTWTEPFHVEELAPPGQSDAIGIVVAQLPPGEADVGFPPVRRAEVVSRLGANPGVLRLLGLMLTSYTLEELLPPALAEQDESSLAQAIEQRLLAKAAEGLPSDVREFLRALSVMRDWAPWTLVESLHGGSEVKGDVRQLRERYLLQTRASNGRPGTGPNTRYRAHPLVREADNPALRQSTASWRSANRVAGQWYAGRLRSAVSAGNDDSAIAAALDGAQYHLRQADEPVLVAEAIRAARTYVEKRFNHTGQRPTNSGERDAQIGLLLRYHEDGGTSGTHYYLASILLDRGAPDDLDGAVLHSELATRGSDNSDPWMLWIKAVQARDGNAAAVIAGRKACLHVAPAENLYLVYQILAAVLCWATRADEAVAALREGAERALGNNYRLAEAAVRIAAGERDDVLLEEVCAWLEASDAFTLQATLGQALLLERRGRWRDAALLIKQNRSSAVSYPVLAIHEALSWLGAGEPAKAQEALNRGGDMLGSNSGLSWLASFIAHGLGDFRRSSQHLGTYLGTAHPPTDAAGIRSALLSDWDNSTFSLGRTSIRSTCPILPSSLTGLPSVVVRPLYGDPVLTTVEEQDERPHHLVLATEWYSAHGGLSTFNRYLCTALAAAGKQVSCVVLEFTDDEQENALAKGVTLVRAPRTPGASDSERLSRKPELPAGRAPELIIGHGRITGSAAHRLADDFPDARRVHFIHMIPDDIERHKLDRGLDIGVLAEERQLIELELSEDAHCVAAVGPRMYNWFLRDLVARDVEAKRIIQFDPGFDGGANGARTKPAGSPVTVLVFGRTEDSSLKGLDIAARGFAKMRQRRRDDRLPVELLVRGAPAGSSRALEEEMKVWANDSSLPVRVRAYSTKAERLTSDLRAASLVLVPSRAEGFGLVGLEAITAGTPVLVSSASGLGELLQNELLTPEEAARVVVRTTGDLAQDSKEWSRAMEAVLLNRDASFTWAGELRTRLAGLRTWSSAVAKLLEAAHLNR